MNLITGVPDVFIVRCVILMIVLCAAIVVSVLVIRPNN